ncbi:MAG: hypothetical protein ACT4PP_07975 [Sporichthyaceae bacterium]
MALRHKDTDRGGVRYERLARPVVGSVRSAASNLAAQRDGVDDLLAAAAWISFDAEGGAGVGPMDALVEAVLMVLQEETRVDAEPHRDRLAGLARFGWAVGAAEDAAADCVVGLTHPHVHTALLYLALENRVEDPMMKNVTDWILEAAYYQRRTSRALSDVLTTLYLDLPELFPGRLRPARSAPVRVGLPAQRKGEDRRHAVTVGAAEAGAA